MATNGEVHAKAHRNYREPANRLEKATDKEANFFYDDHQLSEYLGCPVW
jgi:hypothetical protein